ncbi:unnamed protein product [Rhizoctonia solani]|uniref:Calpain catalytic domain-containing protein n=1 Tax=Rhizoctonia solani TaxID=456999 RepID=A0A8H3E099_9AGAM|nr:unnamed protein product [Rhizoctonia solani]
MPGILSYIDRIIAPEVQDKSSEPKPPSNAKFGQKKERAGLLCTAELEVATTRCRRRVEAIIKDCRARNCRFRDLEFDLEEDKDRCLYGLNPNWGSVPRPADVLRVTQIFEEPQFFIYGASSSDIVQGVLDDSSFLSGVSTVATMEGLINRICVHRDEEIGVYGFVFYRDPGWVDVIIDDLLCTRIPRYEELDGYQQGLYHGNKEQYEARARVGGQTLQFSRSKTENETWLPLLEKAYAKLNGDYQAIIGGLDAEAIEALTGGISILTPIKDILNTNKFWNELLNINKDRLFGCSIDGARAGQITGLITSHAYSVLEALEVNGKRFVRIRNPWGKSEWKGPWSDGAKEWTSEWLARLPELRHQFGDDGEFLMEYKDFLKTWTTVERSRIFDADWKLSSMWLNVTSRNYPCAWSFGDVSFAFSVTEDSPAAIVLSQLNDRAFGEISGYNEWSMDFVVYRKGAPSEEHYVRSNHSWFWQRVVVGELDNLEAGDYVLHVRLDRSHHRKKTYYQDSLEEWDARKLSKKWTQAALSKSIAVNFVPEPYGEYLPVPENLFGGEDLNSLEGKQIALEAPQSMSPSVTNSPIIVSEQGDHLVVDANEKPNEGATTNGEVASNGEATPSAEATNNGETPANGEPTTNGNGEPAASEKTTTNGEAPTLTNAATEVDKETTANKEGPSHRRWTTYSEDAVIVPYQLPNGMMSPVPVYGTNGILDQRLNVVTPGELGMNEAAPTNVLNTYQ